MLAIELPWVWKCSLAGFGAWLGTARRHVRSVWAMAAEGMMRSARAATRNTQHIDTSQHRTHHVIHTRQI